MKKSILNLGKALNKAEQKEISGGRLTIDKCAVHGCNSGYFCTQSGCKPGMDA